jgi:TolA-binding protein
MPILGLPKERALVPEQQQRILVVMGPEGRAASTARALTHRDVQVVPAFNEQGVLGAVSGSQFDLAVVGGRIGRRGPLITCEAVRVRQQGLRVLVVVDAGVDQQALAEHRARQLDRLSYLDVSAIPADGDGLLEIGERIRSAVLSLLQLPDDPDGRERWIEAETQTLPEPEPAPSSPEPMPEGAEHTGSVGAAEDLIAGADPGPVTQEDLAFAERVAEHVKHVDFRAPKPQAAEVPESGPERMVTKLRDRVRELEWQLARLAHVYGHRNESATRAAERLRWFEAELRVAEEERDRLQTNLTQETENLAAARAARGAADNRLKETLAAQEELKKEIERAKRDHAEAEQKLSAMLDETGAALSAVRDQASASREEWESQLGERRREIEAAMRTAEASDEQLRSLQEQLDAAKRREIALVEEGQAAQVALREETQRRETELLEEIRKANQAYAERERDLVARLEAATQAQAEREQQLLAQLREATESGAEREQHLREATVEATELRKRLEAELAEAQQAQNWRALEAQETLVRERAQLEAEVTGLRARVEHDGQEAESLRKTVATLRDQIDALKKDLDEAEARRKREVEATGAHFEDAGKVWEERVAKIKKSTVALSDRIVELETAAAAKDQSIARMEGEIGAREDQIAQLEKANKEANNALARERIGFAEALDAKLSELERFGRESSERMVRLVEALLTLDERSRRQEELTQKLLGGVTANGEIVDAAAFPALRRRKETGLAGLIQDKPVLVGGMIGGLGVLVVILLVILLLPRGAPGPAPQPLAAGASLAAAPEAPPEASDAEVEAKSTAEGEASAKPDAEPEPEAEPEAAQEAQPEMAQEPQPEAAQQAKPEPEPGAQPAAAPDLTPAPSAVNRNPEALSASQNRDRKRIRKAMHAAYKTKKWKTAALLGKKLRDEYALDWESEFMLGDALRHAGAADEAIAAFRGFIAAYPKNVNADDAAWWMANLLFQRGDKKEAIELYERVAGDKVSNFRGKAKNALKRIR